MIDRELFSYRASIATADGQSKTVEVRSYWSPAKEWVFGEIARVAAAMETASTRSGPWLPVSAVSA